MALGTPYADAPTTFASAGTSAVPYPTGTVPSAGDFLLMTISLFVSGTVTTPAGWTLIDGFSNTGNTLAPTIYAFWKIAAGGESGTVTVTHSTGKSEAQIAGQSGADQTTPIDVAPVHFTSGSVDQSAGGTANCVITGLTLVFSGCTVYTVSSSNAAAQTATPPSGYTEIADGSGANVNLHVSYKTGNSSGATGSQTVVWSGTGKQVGFLVAVRPAALVGASPTHTRTITSGIGPGISATPTHTRAITSAISAASPSGTDVGGLASTQLEVYLNSVWTDITAYAKMTGGSILRTVGRGNETDDAQPGSLTFTVDNVDGRFYPDSPTIRVVTAGVVSTSPNPYYPYFGEDTQVRWTVNDGTSRRRFLGWITSIDPSFDGTRPEASIVQVTATDTLGRMNRGELAGYVAQQILLDSPNYYYPLDEPAGATLFADATGHAGAGTILVKPAGGITAGDSTPATVEGFPAVYVVGTATSSEASRLLFPTAVALPATNWTMEFCANIRASASSGGELYHQLATDGLGNTYGLTVNYISAANGTLTFKAFIGMTTPPGIVTELVVTSPSGYAATGFYHVVVTLSSDGKTGYLWINGAWATTTIGAAVTWLAGGIPQLKAGNASLTGHDIGNLAFYTGVMTAARIAVHATGSTSTGIMTAGSASATTVAAMAQDAAGWAGFTPTLESGFGPQNTTAIATTGRTPLDVFLTVIRGEGGLVYDNAAGLYCRARSALNSTTVGATFDIDGDLQGSPSLSRSTLNKVAYATATSVSQSVTVSDAAAITELGKSAAVTLETSLADANELYSVASHRVEQGVNRVTRFSRVAVDLYTAKNNLYSAVLTLQPGDRVRLSNLPSDFMGATYTDGYVLGWTEELSWDAGYLFTFDLVPADPVVAELGFDTFRFAAGDGNGSTGVLTATGTTVVITTTGLPWSASAGDYPADLWINGERDTLTAAPGGAVSPQTFAGVTRGVDPTTKRSHSAAEAVEVWDAARFAF